MGKVVMYSTVSVDGFIADEQRRPFDLPTGPERHPRRA